MTTTEALVAGAIRSHNTDTSDATWDADEARRRLPSESGPLREAHAHVSDGSENAKGSYAGLHHEVTADGEVGPANLRACELGIHALNRADSAIPAGDRDGAYAHLRNHLLSAGRPEHTIPALRDRAEAATEGGEGGTMTAAVEAAMPMEDSEGVAYRRWRAPVAVVEGVWSGDDRLIEADALSWRDLPLSLMAQMETADGHDGAQVVGRIDRAERVDASAMVDSRTGQPYGEGAYAIALEGVFDNDELAARVAEKVRGGFLRGVSVDLSDVELVDELVDGDGNPVDLDDEDADLTDVRLRTRLTAGRLMGLTVVAHPAFEGAFIELVGDEGNAGPATERAKPTREQQAASVRIRAALATRTCAPCESGGLTAGAAPVEPPREWFDDPRLAGPTGITITDEGRVFGHLADWNTCHTGYTGQCVRPPRSATNYAVFRTGAVKCSDGSIVPVGQITVDAGHADTRRGVSALDAMAHYDNIATAVADIVAGEDAHGIWVAGALRPDATPEQIRALRASRLSGDWRPWGGNRELIGAHAVNTPGFPVLRQITASGEFVALIAVGPPPATMTAPELAEVRALLPALTAAAERERAAQEREADAARARAAAERDRMRSLTAAALRAQVGT